jgi:hypothetical protein
MRDFLLSLAAESAYLPCWNRVILAELEYLERKRHAAHGLEPDDASRAANLLIGRMGQVFPGALVDGWEHLEGSFGLPDPADEHVAATATVARASVIVTSNLRDFPDLALPAAVRVESPAAFAARLARRDPASAAAALTAMSSRLRRPPMTPTEVLDYLETRNGFAEAAELLRIWLTHR